MSPRHGTLTVLGAVLLAGSTACASHDAAAAPQASPSQSAPQPFDSPAAAPTITVVPTLSIPPVAAHEVSRIFYDKKARTVNSTYRARARAGQDYELVAACVAATPGQTVGYELLSSTPRSQTKVSGGTITCDGTVTRDVGPLPATVIQIRFDSDLSTITSAYAVLAPAT